MTNDFQTAGMRIDARQGTLTNEQGDICKLRPKTFQLLLFLIRSPESLFSKTDIMEAIWPDVVVGEHVVFQSIKEIRQAFSQQEVIKTLPRQGYSWIAPVELLDQSPQKQSEQKKPNTLHRRSTFFVLLTICVLLVAVLAKLSITQPESPKGSILVLPVKIAVDDNDHAWVRLGGMDQLTQRLASSEQSGVLHTDYVLEIMDRAGVTKVEYSAEDIKQIYMVSGASLVVELELAGTPREYQLNYRLHRRAGVNKGVLFGEHIPELFEQMAQTLASERGIGLLEQTVDYSSGFANEIVANALEAKRDNNTEKAEQLLQAAMLSEPHNLTTKRLLLEIWVADKDFDNTSPLIEDAKQSMQQLATPTREHVRLHFWFALNQLQQQKLAAAEPYLEQAESLATELKDWLYLAYIAEIRGQMAQYSKDYDEAELAYRKAMDYHEVLHCPHGQSNGLLNLSMLAEDRGERERASQFLSQAMKLIQTRELNTLLPKAESWMNRLEKKHTSAE